MFFCFCSIPYSIPQPSAILRSNPEKEKKLAVTVNNIRITVFRSNVPYTEIWKSDPEPEPEPQVPFLHALVSCLCFRLVNCQVYQVLLHLESYSSAVNLQQKPNYLLTSTAKSKHRGRIYQSESKLLQSGCLKKLFGNQLE